MRVGMCDYDCVRLFFVSSWVLDCSLCWISLGAPCYGGPISSLPHYLPVVGVSARWCTCGSRFSGLGALVCAGSDMSRGLGSLGPGLDPLGHRRSRWGLWARLCSSLVLLHCGSSILFIFSPLFLFAPSLSLSCFLFSSVLFLSPCL
ncbi:hypothetical protein AMECASPLE_007570 [Ameca splendens]|uniref:Uncharacterized protein n=1 Tax=Ameca splendens TaxID=208324 RepID=A0ABV0ZXP9_9TELE